MSVEVTELLGPERSLLVIDGGSATAVAWKWERQEAGETHVWVCMALTMPRRYSLPTLDLAPSSPPSPSLTGRKHSGGGVEIAKNSHVFGTCSFQGINGIRNEILALISHICWVLSP